MSWESFSVYDKNGNKIYLGDYGLYIGKTDSGLWKEIFLPDTEDYTDKVTGMDGEYFFGSSLKPREITVPVFAIDISETHRRELQRILFSKAPVKLEFDRRPYQYIFAKKTREIDMDYLYKGDYYDCLVELRYTAYDPLFYSHYKSTYIPKRGDADPPPTPEETFMYDAGIPYIDSDLWRPSLFNSDGISEILTNDGEFQLYNGGNYFSKCIITIQGSGRNIVITNTTTNQSFKISKIDNEVLVIDGLRGIVISGAGNTLRTEVFDGDFIVIESGLNDMVMTGENLNLTKLSFEYRYTYL